MLKIVNMLRKTNSIHKGICRPQTSDLRVFFGKRVKAYFCSAQLFNFFDQWKVTLLDALNHVFRLELPALKAGELPLVLNDRLAVGSKFLLRRILL